MHESALGGLKTAALAPAENRRIQFKDLASRMELCFYICYKYKAGSVKP
jgi:hypothetical protein